MRKLFVFSMAFGLILGSMVGARAESQGNGNKTAGTSAEAGSVSRAERRLIRRAESIRTTRVLVTMQSPAKQEAIAASLERTNADVLTEFTAFPILLVEADAGVIGALASDPRVIGLQEDVVEPPTLASSIPHINADDVHGLGLDGDGTAIAILDTGIDEDHPFFAGRIVSEVCFSDGNGDPDSISLCPNGTITQSGTGAANAETAQCLNGAANICQHGSHVAGIGAGNENGMATPGAPGDGVAPGAEIVAVQVFSRFNAAGDCTPAPAPCVLTYTSDQVRGLEYVANSAPTTPIVAANMSLGGGGPFTSNCDATEVARKTAIDALLNERIATVISAGNNSYAEGVGRPACISTAITVGSTTDPGDVVASTSNRGALLDLFAPGVSITSSVPNNTYAVFNGTSMAAPHVTGAWAVLREAFPTESVAQILARLQTTGVPITNGTSNSVTPRIDLLAAYNAQPCPAAGPGAFANPAPITVPATGSGPANASPYPSSLAVSGLSGTITDVNVSICGLGHTFPDDVDVLLVGPDGTTNIAVMTDVSGGTDITGMVYTFDDAAVASMADGVTSLSGTYKPTQGTTCNGTCGYNGSSVPPAPHGRALSVFNGLAPNGTWRLYAYDDTAGDTGQIATGWRLQITTATNPSPPSDFNGDGRSDIMWRNASSGEDYLWFMNGTQIGSHGPTLTLADTAWKVAGTGDFNGDAKADIVWRNSSTGEVYVWLMNGTTLSSHGSVFTLSDQNWKLVGTGDFNGDAKSDLLWRNAVTGENYLWFMNGTALSSASALLTLSDLNWKVSGTGDFNGDAKSDIVWRNSSNGQVYVWLMNGATITSSGAVFTLADPNWKVAGTGDYDGDGKSDLLWRNDLTGENYLWFMNGTALSSSGALLTLNVAWKVAGTGDYDGNGKADIVWRNSSTGEVYVWLMNGTTIASHGSTFTLADPNWEIVPSNPPAGQAFGAASSSDMTFTVSTKAKPKLTAGHSHLWWHRVKGDGPRITTPTGPGMTWSVKG